MKNEIINISDLILFLKRWGIIIIILTIIAGIYGTKIITPRYANSIVLKVTPTNDLGVKSKKAHLNYAMAIDEVKLLKRVEVFNEKLEAAKLPESIPVVNDNIMVIPTIDKGTIEIKYISTDKKDITKTLNIYTNTLIAQMSDFYYPYKFKSISTTGIQVVEETLQRTIITIIGFLVSIFICAFLNIIFFRKKKEV